MKTSKFIRRIKKVIMFSLLLIVSGSLNSCVFTKKANIQEFSTENEIKTFEYQVKDEMGNERDSSTSQSARGYSFQANTTYFLSMNMEIDCKNEILNNNMEILINAKKNIKVFDVEEAETANVTRNDNKLRLSYSITDTILRTPIILNFQLIEPTSDITECFAIYASSSENVYVNNFDYFSYSISDYFGALLGYTDNVSYSYMYYGKAPQSHVSDEKTIKELNKIDLVNENGYYELDGIEYAKIGQSSVNSNKTYSDGSKVTDGLAYFKVEPILWRVVSQNSNKYRLISVYSIDLYEKNVDKKAYKDWFTYDEKQSISGEKIENVKTDELSSSYNGFSSDETRRSLLTDYAIANGVSMDSHRICSWTNKIGYNKYFKVNQAGECTSKERDISSNTGFRPFITVSKGGYIFRSNRTYTIIGSIIFGLVFFISFLVVASNDEWLHIWIHLGFLVAYGALLAFTALNWWALLILGVPYLIAIIILEFN